MVVTRYFGGIHLGPDQFKYIDQLHLKLLAPLALDWRPKKYGTGKESLTIQSNNLACSYPAQGVGVWHGNNPPDMTAGWLFVCTTSGPWSRWTRDSISREGAPEIIQTTWPQLHQMFSDARHRLPRQTQPSPNPDVNTLFSNNDRTKRHKRPNRFPIYCVLSMFTNPFLSFSFSFFGTFFYFIFIFIILPLAPVSSRQIAGTLENRLAHSIPCTRPEFYFYKAILCPSGTPTK